MAHAITAPNPAAVRFPVRRLFADLPFRNQPKTAAHSFSPATV